jgi:tetratricopeptide (TPR) repeat protein
MFRPSVCISVCTFCGCFLLLFSKGEAEIRDTHAGIFKKATTQQEVIQAERFGRKACEMAIQEKEFEKASGYYLSLGKIFYDRGNYLPGIAQALAGLRIIEQFKIDNDTLKFNYFSLLSASYSRLPMSDSATFWFTKANDWLKQQPLIAKKIPEDVCGHYLNQGLFYGWTGDFGRSTTYLQEALVLSKAVKNIRLESITYNYLGNSYFKQLNFRKANHYYRKALTGYRAGSADKCWGEIILGKNFEG